MKSFFNKVASGIAGVAIFLVGCVLAGIGLSFVFFLALFGLAAIGLGILAAPLVALIQNNDSQSEEETVAA